jgi:signal transduction histidine kinase
MDKIRRRRVIHARHLRLGLVWALTPCIFAFDTLTNYEIAGAVFYLVVILLAVGLLSTRGVIALAGLCVVLTVLSLAMTPKGNLNVGLINAGISIAAIGIATFLAIRIFVAEGAANEARSQLTRIARITGLDALTTSIAHEINQPLAAIVTSGQAGLRWLEQGSAHIDKVRNSLDRTVIDAKRASDIIARVRALAKGGVSVRENVSLSEIVLDTLNLARPDILRHAIEVNMDLGDDLPLVLVDRVQLRQVISNLILNAIEALKSAPVQNRTIEIHARTDTHDEVVISVRDNGSGICEDVLDQIFDPFFTTRDEGIGMGLTISRSIVDAHGGQMWVHPNVPRGASIYFSLPVRSDTTT